MDIPQIDTALPHHIDIQPRFGDYDMFGHVNNTIYMQYFDLGKAMFLTDLLGGDFSPEAVGAVIVNANVNYFAPTRPGEPIAVLTGCNRLGDRSFRIYQQAVNPVTGAVKADALTILAGFDVHTQGPAPLPARLVAALRQSNPAL